MQIIVEILNEKAYPVLEGLAALDVIRLGQPILEKQVDYADSLTVNRPRVDLSRLRQSFNTGLTMAEIDTQLQTIRDEWERDFS